MAKLIRQKPARRFRFGILMAMVAAGLGVLTPQVASAAGPQLTSTGSSLAGVAVSQWQGQFNELKGGNVNFTVSASSIGLNSFAQDTVDFAASDYTYAVSSGLQPAAPYQYVPDIGYALSFEYNLTGTDGQQITNLVLNAPTIVGIFTGAITSWNDPTIVVLNPTVDLPATPVTAFYRSDPAGENDILSAYGLQTDSAHLTHFQEKAGVPTPGQPSTTWAAFADGTPPKYASLVGVNGADAASQGPVHEAGGMAYVAEPYAKNVGLPTASVVNVSGTAVQPTTENAATALKGATLNTDLSANLTGVFSDPSSTAYPVSAVSYFVVPCSPALAGTQDPTTSCSADNNGTSTFGTSQGAELGRFIRFDVCKGQAKLPDLGYAPLPRNLVADAEKAIGRINGATQPPPPTRANCANPEIGNH